MANANVDSLHYIRKLKIAIIEKDDVLVAEAEAMLAVCFFEDGIVIRRSKTLPYAIEGWFPILGKKRPLINNLLVMHQVDVAYAYDAVNRRAKVTKDRYGECSENWFALNKAGHS